METNQKPFGQFYHPSMGTNYDAYLADVKPELVLKYRIGGKFGNYRKFSEAGCGLTELQISQVVCGRRSLAYPEALKFATMLELPAGYLMAHFGPKKEGTTDDE